ncbi:MAG: hypothetical protein IJL69_03165 [Oscillospiraceae bacterium]|nr:hypothetical protein [Oscillospiraceae bacterium]
MYRVSVPLVRFYRDQDEAIRQARRLGATRVFLCVGRGLGSEAENAAEIARLAENVPLYRAAGFEVGVWLSTIGHGGELVGAARERGSRFANIVGLRGKSPSDSFCPLDDGFSGAVCAHLTAVAGTGPDLIMIDDDFRLSNRGDCGCSCEAHLREYGRRVGRPVRREDVIPLAFSGKPNAFRRAWMDLMGDTLRDFARRMRAAVDRADPSIRLGACACMSVWDADGVDSLEIARILAGRNRPFLRLIGAAYWPTSWGPPCRELPYVAELERMQRFWCRNEEIEIFSEGDVYPRPRHFVPAAYLEAFDTILRADGGLDGILKYGVDYVSSPAYETGYADRARRSEPIYAGIEELFGGKRAAGVSVACEMHKLADRDMTDFGPLRDGYDDGFFQPEQAILAYNTVPIVYGEAAVRAVFGENGKHAPAAELPGGLLLDAAAAVHLAARGLDVGLISAGPLDGPLSGLRFDREDEIVPATDARGAVRVRPAPGAEVLARYAGADPAPLAYRYESADGRRVTVLAFDAEKALTNERLWKSYCFQRLLLDQLAWLARGPLPAVCAGNPALYLRAARSEDGGALTVGLWNVFPDAVLDPVITLDRAYGSVRFLNCGGRLEQRAVRLDRDIPPFGFAAFEVSDRKEPQKR